MKAPAVQRQIDDLLVGDHLAERRGLRVQERRLGRDQHFRRQRADRQRELDARRLPDGQLDPLAHRRLEPGNRGRHFIGARIERSDDVAAFEISDHRSREVGGNVSHRDRRTRNAGVLRVIDGPDDAGALQLSEGGGGAGEPEREETRETRKEA